MTQSFVNVIRACMNAEGSGSKEIIKSALSTLDEGARTLCRYAMDPFLVFGVKKYDRPTEYAEIDNPNLSAITQTLDKLASRELTGNAARTAVADMLAQFTADTASFLELIIDKNLQAGFSLETYNKIASKMKWELIRDFSVQLADKCADFEEFEKHVKFPCYADTKLDGERNIAFQLLEESNFAPAGSSYRSRSGKIAEHMNGLFDEELARIREYLGYDFIIDGERLASDYTETTNAKKSGAEGDKARANMRLNAFFLMPLTHWIAQKTDISTEQNQINLAEILKACNCVKIILPSGRIVQDYADMMVRCDEVTTPGFEGMPKGQEGLILKNLSATYTWDRTHDWCKVKKFYEVDCRCVSWEFGKNKNAARMGRVNVVGFLEDGTRVECGVGSGWTDDQRQDVMDRWDSFWQYAVIEVKYQEVSKGKNKEFSSLRFPTFNQRIRDDKNVEI